MRKLRILFNTIIAITLISLWLMGHMFEVDTITLKASVIWLAIGALVILLCALGNWIIYDHQQNHDWLEYLNEKPLEDCHPTKRQR